MNLLISGRTAAVLICKVLTTPSASVRAPRCSTGPGLAETAMALNARSEIKSGKANMMA